MKKLVIVIVVFIIACCNIQHGEYVHVPDDVFRKLIIGYNAQKMDKGQGIKRVINNNECNLCLLKDECYEIRDFSSGKIYPLEELDDDKNIDLVPSNDIIYVKNGSALYFLDGKKSAFTKLDYKFNEFSTIYRYKEGVLTVDDDKAVVYVAKDEISKIGKIDGHIKGVMADDVILVLEDGGEYELNLNTNEKKYFARNHYRALEYKDDKVLMVMLPKGSEIGQAIDVGVFYEGGLKFEIINVFEPFVYNRKNGRVTKYVTAVW